MRRAAAGTKRRQAARRPAAIKKPEPIVRKKKPIVEEEEDEEEVQRMEEVEDDEGPMSKRKKPLFGDDDEEEGGEEGWAEFGEVAAGDDEEEDEGSEMLKKKAPKISDENKRWLKLVEDQPATNPGEGPLSLSDDEDEFDDEEGDGEELEFERQARRADEKQKRVEEEADEEMQTNIRQQQKFVLPSGRVVEGEGAAAEDLATISARVQEVAKVLANWKQEREEGRTRQEYLERLTRDLASYHGCSDWLVSKLLSIFSVGEAIEYLESSESPRPVTVRVNALKARRRDLAQVLIARGVNLDPVPWSKVGLVVYDSQVPIGATPEYLAGQYMLQSAASWLPVMALGPQPGEKVLDMCAAPGGKTTHLAAMMRNSGLLVANDSNEDRLKALVANTHRMGVRNIVVSCYDGREFPKVMAGFNKILVDAPCTGLGVLSRDQSIKVSKSEDDVTTCARVQKELILSAIDSLDCTTPGGAFMVYSTCSITVEENEAVVDYALSKRDVRVVASGLEFGTPGFVKWKQHRFHPSLNLARRYYPHTHNLDGFFVCRLQKISDSIPGAAQAVASTKNKKKKASIPLTSTELRKSADLRKVVKSKNQARNARIRNRLEAQQQKRLHQQGGPKRPRNPTD